MIGTYGGPVVSATPDELQDIKGIYHKCFDDNQTPNWWFACYEILHHCKSKVTKGDLKKMDEFIRNNGGMITDSESVIKHILDSLKMYLDNKRKS